MRLKGFRLQCLVGGTTILQLREVGWCVPSCCGARPEAQPAPAEQYCMSQL